MKRAILALIFVATAGYGATKQANSISASKITVPSGAGIAGLNVTQNDTSSSSSHGVVVTSTGTGNAIKIITNGVPSNGLQNATGGAINVRMNGISEGIVIYSSITDSQAGSSFLFIKNDAPLYNDPLIWIKDVGAQSNPVFRADSAAPDIEIVNTSTDNAVGLGKWEPIAMANTGVNLQINSRAFSNGTFERVAEWQPRSKGVALALYPTNLGEDSNPTPTTTGKLLFYTTDTARQVGIRGPMATTASWYWTLPATFNNAGNVMYQSSDGPDRNLSFTSGGFNGNMLVKQNNDPVWGTAEVSTATIAGLAAITPTRVGQMYYCTDCSNTAVCVSTATTLGGFSRIAGRTLACN